MGSHSLLQGIFPPQGLNHGCLHCRRILYHLSHQGNPHLTVHLKMVKMVKKILYVFFYITTHLFLGRKAMTNLWVCVCVCVCEVAQSCPTLCNPVDCSPPDSSVHRILQARILEWVAISFSRGSSQPRDRSQISCVAGGFFTS